MFLDLFGKINYQFRQKNTDLVQGKCALFCIISKRLSTFFSIPFPFTFYRSINNYFYCFFHPRPHSTITLNEWKFILLKCLICRYFRLLMKHGHGFRLHHEMNWEWSKGVMTLWWNYLCRVRLKVHESLKNWGLVTHYNFSIIFWVLVKIQLMHIEKSLLFIEETFGEFIRLDLIQSQQDINLWFTCISKMTQFLDSSFF